MLNIRNEILESGQQVLLFVSPNWTGSSGVIATLIDRRCDNTTSECWNIRSTEGIMTSWWIGKPDRYDKILSMYK